MTTIRLHDLDELATKSDLGVLKADLAVLKADLAAFKAELHAFKSEMRSEFTVVRADMTALEARFETRLATEIGALRKSMSNWMLTMLVAIIGAMIGVGVIT